MADVLSRYSGQTDQQSAQFDMETQRQLDNKLNHIDDKVRTGTVELEGNKIALTKLKTQNKDLVKQIRAAEDDKKTLNTKLGSIKVKLGLSNANLTVGNDEKETLRSNLNEELILVARMEERLASTATELDRLRDPANPESNMSIRKHIVNDKKEIKRLKSEIETEHNLLAEDSLTARIKDEEIKRLEKELSQARIALKTSDNEKQQMQHDRCEEERLKVELQEAYKALILERKSYESRLKNMKVKLGTAVSAQNVAAKIADEMKAKEKNLVKQVNSLERKSKEAAAELDVLRNQHKMSKTAQSINDYTRRTQMKRGEANPMSLAQSGPGPVKFGKQGKQGLSKISPSTSRSSLVERQRNGETGKQKGNDGTYVLKGRDKNGGSKAKERTSDSSVKGSQHGRTQSNGLVPPPRPKLGNSTR